MRLLESGYYISSMNTEYGYEAYWSSSENTTSSQGYYDHVQTAPIGKRGDIFEFDIVDTQAVMKQGNRAYSMLGGWINADGSYRSSYKRQDVPF